MKVIQSIYSFSVNISCLMMRFFFVCFRIRIHDLSSGWFMWLVNILFPVLVVKAIWWCELLGVYESGFAERKETFAENLQDTVLCWIQQKLKWWKSSLFNEKCIYVNGCVYSNVKSLYFPFSVTCLLCLCVWLLRNTQKHYCNLV